MNAQSQADIDLEICLRGAEDEDRYYGALLMPTFENVAFTYQSFEHLVNALKAEGDHYLYWRGTNPTVQVLEKKLAALERGEVCKCFASGMAAVSAAILSSVQTGDHVLCLGHVYVQTRQLLNYLRKFGIASTSVYETSIEDCKQAVQENTKVIYIESPSDLLYRMVDLNAVAQFAKSVGVRTILDNTWAGPLFQKPITFGIDIVVESVSKHLAGHSDVVAGAVITSRDIMKDLFNNEYLLLGASMAPHLAALALRGLRTYLLRMPVHEQNALSVAAFLESHPAVERVHYPGLKSHPDYELGRKQLTGYSGLMSFQLKDSTYHAVKSVIDRTKVFQIGVSWGGPESLIESPNLGDNEQALLEQGLNPGLIRLAIGLQRPETLIRDLDQALEGASDE